jgi:hypothetical protein
MNGKPLCNACCRLALEAEPNAAESRNYSQEHLQQLFLEYFEPLAKQQRDAGFICAIQLWRVEATDTGANLLIQYAIRKPDTGWEDQAVRIPL